MAKTIYITTRDCCQHGNCTTCTMQENHKYGDKVRCLQYIGEDKARAEKVANNWQAYNGKAEEATTEAINNLHGSSALYALNWIEEHNSER